MRAHRRSFARFGHLPLVAVCLAVCLAIAGCASVSRTPYTAQEAAVAQPVGYQNIRVWLDGTVPNPAEFAPNIPPSGADYLALSGGGGNGAYGAGILNGWTQSGKRPTFTAVSGVSTGALIAPFAFLGSAYDEKLRGVYTDGKAQTLVSQPNVIEGAFGSSLFGGNRLLDLVSQYVDGDMVAAIAAEHAKGRRLYVVTTNIDSKRGVVWNIGAIAASGRPDAIDLIRKVLAASASVPLAFSPQLIEVQADGRAFREMHVDGNVTTAVFTLPLQYLGALKKTRLSGGRIYILMNTSIEPEFSMVEDQTLPIVGASIGTLTTQKALEDLVTTYAYASRNAVDFNLTSIDPSIDESGAKSFDTAYMRRLYEVGYQEAIRGGFWRKAPPTLTGAQPSAKSRSKMASSRP